MNIKQPITIRAAILGGIFVLIGAVISGLFEITRPNPTIIILPPSTDPIQSSPIKSEVVSPVDNFNGIYLGQDGSDYAISGCSDGVQGLTGVIDNHIRLTGVTNVEDVEKVDVIIGEVNHWQHPCNWPNWDIVMHKDLTGIIDLYFEPAYSDNKMVTYEVKLIYSNKDVLETEVMGSSGSDIR